MSMYSKTCVRSDEFLYEGGLARASQRRRRLGALLHQMAAASMIIKYAKSHCIDALTLAIPPTLSMVHACPIHPTPDVRNRNGGRDECDTRDSVTRLAPPRRFCSTKRQKDRGAGAREMARHKRRYSVQ